MYNPIATYRIQFHKSFSLEAFDSVIAYLKQLGISTVYASPVFAASPDSMHGYDGIDPLRINPEIGSEEQLRGISKKLKEAGIGWLQDIVPNHMAFHPKNAWLMDVLEKGSGSEYAGFFDILWGADSRLMVPVLGASLEEVIARKELKLAYESNKMVLKYFVASFPLSPSSYQSYLNDLHVGYISEERIAELNAKPDILKQLADHQHYRLCHWQETDQQINYRRFFTVNGLICLNIQDEAVFSRYHEYIKKMVDEGVFQGLRIDHVDGLYDPTQYLHALRKLVGEETYVVVEKILEHEENLPEHWPIQGTTGYEFLALVNNLFTNKEAEASFTAFYQELVPGQRSIKEQLYEKKAHILYQHMAGELENLFALYNELGLHATSEGEGKASAEDIKRAIGEFLLHCPVYRYYGNQLPLGQEEAKAVKKILKRIREGTPELSVAADNLEDMLLQQPLMMNEAYNAKVLRFYQRCMQFSGPLMAKGMEDTLMYTYNRFIGHNDVGDSPEAFGIAAEVYHRKMQERLEHWPLAINATATHDTKRGEDVRARLNVLTDMPDTWVKVVGQWQAQNKALKTNGWPDNNDEYFIYQTLLGTYPMPGEADDDYRERLVAYMEKAVREAKVHTNWTSPNTEYEGAVSHFIDKLLDKESEFWASFMKFRQKVVDYGIVNSLAQVLLKFTCPGVPDTYQGTELWDLSMVDPDNRRPVDYTRRQQMLDAFGRAETEPEMFLQQLWESRYSGQVKLWLTHTLQQLRRQNPQLFCSGQYIPLQVKGKFKDHVFAFLRRYQHDWVLVAVPLHCARASRQKKEGLLPDWKDTRIVLPETAYDKEWTNLFDKTRSKNHKEIEAAELFKSLPIAVLQHRPVARERSAGLLLSITSLPGRFGVGDMGPEAMSFVRFLSESHQRYWQLLPLNPTEKDSGHSPYSSYSAMAGNTLLISPELLEKEGLLEKEDLTNCELPSKEKADFDGAMQCRKTLFEKAWKKFVKGDFGRLKSAFEAFCRKEAYWLDDLSLYVILKDAHQCTPWYEWPEEFRNRNKESLERFALAHKNAIDKEKWLQFIFARQWHALKAYSNSLGVELYGDLPFYISYDSADVWSNREIFSLDEAGNMTGIAGVPPDYFSEDGQLWGMPTFNWDVLKVQGYRWWINRLRKNLQNFDLLRIDHFRAFAEYWKVPAGETTARNGEWLAGPGAAFFELVEREFGKLPFVAEDLGDRMEQVYVLRNKLGLPGMKVLQFAFGENMPESVDIPHNHSVNCVVYTGTHDNNTTLGWYLHESNKADHRRLEHYLGYKPKAKEIDKIMTRMAYGSVAKIAIIPMQDLLGLDEKYRMNTPGRGEGNWQWRMQPGLLSHSLSKQLRNLMRWYNRG